MLFWVQSEEMCIRDRLCTDRGLPFRPSVDPFDSPANQAHLVKAVRQIEEGKVVVKTLDELEAMER